MGKKLHLGFIILSLGIHAFIIFRANKRESVRIPIRMATTQGKVRLEMTKPQKKPPVKKVKKKNVRKIAQKKIVEEIPPLEEEPVSQSIQQDFDQSILLQKAIVYPGVAMRRGWQGVVYLELFIDGVGKVVRAEVKRPHTYKVLSDAAIAGVMGWQFHPRPDARKYSVLKKINFQLRDI